MKSIAISFFVCFLFIRSYAQTGVFYSTHYEWIDEKEPSKNKIEYDRKVFMIDIEGYTTQYFIWEAGEEVTLKWNIHEKLGSDYNREEGVVKTSYRARMEMLGEEAGAFSVLSVIEKVGTKEFNVVIYNPEPQTAFCFFELRKL